MEARRRTPGAHKLDADWSVLGPTDLLRLQSTSKLSSPDGYHVSRYRQTIAYALSLFTSIILAVAALLAFL